MASIIYKGKKTIVTVSGTATAGLSIMDFIFAPPVLLLDLATIGNGNPNQIVDIYNQAGTLI